MKVQLPLLQALILSSLSHATKIYVSSYSGNITTVSVTPNADGFGNLTLAAISSTTGCLPNPSWLELDKNKSTLYCADEGISTAKASFTSFSISSNGTLQRRDEIITLNGGVYSTIYGNGSALALAHYGGSGISIIDIKDPTHLEILQDATFSFEPPRVNPKTNTSVFPYIHQTIIDPTQNFLLAPDLSGDLIHVFSLSSSSTLGLPSGQIDISVPKGHGPRHGVFYQPGIAGNATYLYVVMETANMVHGYQVKYNADKTLNFTMIQDVQLPVPTTAAAAEIRLTPDNKYLIVSSRSDSNFTIPNPDPKNSTQIPSDSLFTFLISPSNGTISLVQRFPAGGLLPRQFEINKAGNMLAVALNGDNRLTIVGRDVAGGNLTRILANLNIDVGGRGPGMVTCAVWDEDDGSQTSKGNSSLATGASTAKSSKTLVPPTSTNKPAVSTGGGLSDEGLISALSASLASVTSKDPNAVGPTLSAIEIMESMISLAESATALEGIIASLTRSNPSATSVAAGVLESMKALSSSMAVLSDDLDSIITKNPVSTTQASRSTPATGIVPSTSPPTILASTTSGSTASATGAVTTPTPFQTGMIGNCTKFHLVVSGDTCSSIATAAGINLSDFYTWNPAVGTSCATLFAENNVCIGVGSHN